MRVSIFSDPQVYSQAKICFYSGKIIKAYKLLNSEDIKTMSEDEKLFFAILNSDLGNYYIANELFISLSPIDKKENVGIPFLKNLYRWKKLELAELYIPKLTLEKYGYYMICGKIYYKLKKYMTAISYFNKASEMNNNGLIYYYIAKCYYLIDDKKNCQILIEKGLNSAKGRMIKFNLKRLKQLISEK